MGTENFVKKGKEHWIARKTVEMFRAINVTDSFFFNYVLCNTMVGVRIDLPIGLIFAEVEMEYESANGK